MSEFYKSLSAPQKRVFWFLVFIFGAIATTSIAAWLGMIYVMMYIGILVLWNWDRITNDLY